MAWTDADEARYQQLGQQLGYIAPPAPAPASLGPLARIGEGLANAPSNVASGLINGVIGIGNVGQPQGYAIPPVNVPKPYAIPPPQTLGQRAADLVPGLLTTVATAGIPGALVARGLMGMGAGAGAAAVAGDFAGGGLLGFNQSPTDAAQSGAEFGALGLLNRAPVPGYVKALGNIGIPVAGQLMRGQNPLSQESLLNTGANVIVPGLLGHYADRLARPQGAPLIPPSAPEQAPPQLLRLNAPPQPGEIRDGVIFGAGPQASSDRSFTTPGYVPPGTGQIPPAQLSLPAPRTLADAASAGDLVSFNGQIGQVKQGQSGEYFSIGDEGVQRIYGNVPDMPLHQIEGLEPSDRGNGTQLFDIDPSIRSSTPPDEYTKWVKRFNSPEEASGFIADTSHLGTVSFGEGANEFTTRDPSTAAQFGFQKEAVFDPQTEQALRSVESGSYTPAIKTAAGDVVTGANHADISRQIESEGGQPGQRGYAKDGGFYSLLDVARREQGPDASIGSAERQADSENHHQQISDAVSEQEAQYPPDQRTLVHPSLDSLGDNDFQGLKARAKAQGLASAEGFHDPITRTTHVLSENVATPDRGIKVAVHERVGHLGVDRVIGKEAWQGIQQHVMEHGAGMRDQITEAYRDKATGEAPTASRIAREYVARVAENTNLDPTLWQKVTAAVRSALRAAGIRREWSDAEIQDLVRAAHKNLKRGEPTLTRGFTSAPPEQSGRTGMEAARRKPLTPAEQSEHQELARQNALSPDLLTSTQRARMEKLGHAMSPKEDSGTSGASQVQDAYNRLASRSGYPAVHISDVAKESGVPLLEVKSLLTRAHEQGKAVLSLGDTSVVSPEVRAGAMDTAAQKGNLLVRLTDRLDETRTTPERSHPFSSVERDEQAARENIPWGKTAVLSTDTDAGRSIFHGASRAFGTASALDMIEGKRPFPSREEFEKGLDNSYWHAGMDARASVRRQLARLGQDPGLTDLPDTKSFRSGKDFYSAMVDADTRMRRSGASAASNLLDPSLPRRLDEAAEKQERGRHSVTGKIGRFLETNLGLSQNDATKLATQRAEGRGQLLTQTANAATSDLISAKRKLRPGQLLVTPQQEADYARFQRSKGTDADVSLLKSAKLPPVVERYGLAHKAVQIEGQGVLAAAETGTHKATIEHNSGDYMRRAYEATSNPVQFLKKLNRGDYDKKLDAVVDEWMQKPEFAGADRTTLKIGWEQFLNDLATNKPFDREGSGSDKISQSLYTTKKDLTRGEWDSMEAFAKDARLNPAEQGLVQDAIRDQHLSATTREAVQKLSTDPRFTEDEHAKLADIAQRQTVSPAVRAILGEYTDPFEREAFTTAKVLRSTKQAEALVQLDKAAMPSGNPLTFKTLEEWQAARNAASGDQLRELLRFKQIPPKDGFGILAGRWAHVSVRDALNDINQGMQAGGDAFWGKIQKVLKLNATVLNPATHAHWWMQMPLMFAMARVYNPLDWLHAGNVVMGSDPAHAGLRDELIRNNIIGAGSQKDLGLNAQKIATPAADETALENIVTKKDKALEFLGKLYGRPDDIIRTAAYLKAKGDALKAGMSPEDAQNSAITYTNRYTFNYGATPRFTKWASNVPGLNPFLSYSSELTRITKNLAQDVLTGSPGDRVHGALNLALMAAVPLAASLGSSTANLSAKDQAEWDQIRKLEDVQRRGQIKFVLGRDQRSGRFNYLDISPVVPAGDTFSIARDLLRGDWKAFAADQPAVGLQHSPIMGLAVDLATGTNQNTGQKLLTPGDYAQRVSQSALPPLLGTQGQRLVRGFSSNQQGGLGIENPRTGRIDTPLTSLLGVAGVRAQSENPGNLLKSVLNDAQQEREAAQQKFMTVHATNASDSAQQSALLTYQKKLGSINAELLARVHPEK